MAYTCTTSPAVTYMIRGSEPGFGRFWAEIVIREWKGGGSINIQSCFGKYAHFWSDIGDVSLREFLCDLEFQYFMEHTRPGEWKQFDPEKTATFLRAHILRRRWSRDIDKAQARRIWNVLDESFTAAELCSSERFSELVELYRGDFVDFPFRESPCPECRNFWNIVWPCACEVWRSEIAVEKERT